MSETFLYIDQVAGVLLASQYVAIIVPSSEPSLHVFQELVGCKKMGDILLETLEASRPAAVRH